MAELPKDKNFGMLGFFCDQILFRKGDIDMKKLLVIFCVVMLSSSFAFAEGVGYWKNHVEERDAFISAAVAMSVVFSATDELEVALHKKGKKSMEEKAKQQLAALLLNIAAYLDTSSLLTQGELEILQLIDPSYDSTATVGDAKDLGEEINNGE
jgi:hypothetical protein